MNEEVNIIKAYSKKHGIGSYDYTDKELSGHTAPA